MTLLSGQPLVDKILHNYQNRLTTSDFDIMGELEGILGCMGASSKDGGGKVTFTGKDPVEPAVHRFATAAGLAMMAKSLMIAAIWRERSGEGQDITVDIRKVLRRFCGFTEQWETINGYHGSATGDPDMIVALGKTGGLFQTKDDRWVLQANAYPRGRDAFYNFLGVQNNAEAISKAIKQWNGADLEQAAEDNYFVLSLCRTVPEIAKLPIFKFICDEPLIKIEKIGESEPTPFKPALTPLQGIRAIGMGHVIAGAGLGRALSLHGADVLNIWRPGDTEFEVLYNAADVGMRSATLEIAEKEARARFDSLLSSADIFFANRRPAFFEKYNLTAEELCARRPGLIYANVSFLHPSPPPAPWAKRGGFDFNTASALGVWNIEGSDDHPSGPEGVHVMNDFITGWLATAGVLMALRRRAKEGGSYKVSIALGRVTAWMMSMGMFDKAYAKATSNSTEEHKILPPDLFHAMTPMGLYRGMTDQAVLSRTPGAYQQILVPRGSSQAEWLNR